jgi:eukaryotic-like serine/threonine-protein kinase
VTRLGQALDFLTREPVDGISLADRLGMGALSAEEALEYGIEIGNALNKAHSRGMVHGKLSPHSICIGESGVHVLAPPSHAEPQTAPYRAPEQVRGETPDSRTDVFAFGAILYEMAAGIRAFPAEAPDLDRSILEDPAPTLTLRSPAYDAIAKVIGGCLEKNPGARRQRVQNAVIELRFAAKASSKSVTAPAQTRIKPSLPPSPAVPAPGPKPRPAEPPRADQFFYKPGEQAARMRNATFQSGLLSLLKRDGPLSLAGYRARMAIVIGASLVLLAGGGVAAAMYFRPRASMPVLKFRVAPPEHTAYPGSPSVSPDGRCVVFSLQGAEGQRMLWIQPLDAEHTAPIAGTENATNPFWSPDSQYLAYFAGRSLKTVRIKDGVTETVTKMDGPSGGGTWNRDGTILYSVSDDGLYKIPAKGVNAPTAVLRVNTNKGESAYMWPQFLPDGKHFLFFLQSDSNDTTGVYGASLDPAEYHMLMASETNAVYSPLPEAPAQKNGYLLFISNRKLMEVGFNAPKMGIAGEPMALADEIGAVRSLALAPLSVSNNATLVYQSTGKPTRQLVWVDRGGVQTAAVRDPGEWGPPRISPDGRKAIAARLSDDGSHADLWLTDREGVTTPFSSNAGESAVCPVWSPDGSKFASALAERKEGSFDVFIRHVDLGVRPDLLFRSSFPKYPRDWSRDGRYIFFDAVSESTKSDVWAVSTADRHAGPILDSVNSESYAALSPDGKWLAYQSDESGKLEVYVQQFDGIASGTRKRWKISSAGGGEPRWRADGKELFFLTVTGRVMAVAVKPSKDEFEFQSPTKLFQMHAIPKVWNLFDVSPDGQQFLVNVPLEWSNSSHITVVTNWTEKLKE